MPRCAQPRALCAQEGAPRGRRVELGAALRVGPGENVDDFHDYPLTAEGNIDLGVLEAYVVDNDDGGSGVPTYYDDGVLAPALP